MTFNGAPPEIFQSLFDEQAAQQHLIDISQSSWVEEYAMQDLATLKLSSYMEHDDLFLQQCHASRSPGLFTASLEEAPAGAKTVRQARIPK